MPVNDLSKVHELVSDLFHWPKSKSDWEKFKLTDDQVSFFNEKTDMGSVSMRSFVIK